MKKRFSATQEDPEPATEPVQPTQPTQGDTAMAKSNSHQQTGSGRRSVLKSIHGPLNFTFNDSPQGREAQKVVRSIYLFGQRPDPLPEIQEDGLVYLRFEYRGDDHTESCSTLQGCVELADEVLGFLNEKKSWRADDAVP